MAEQTIITHPSMDGMIHTVGIIVIEATGVFSWAVPGTSFNNDMLDEMERRGIAINGLDMRNARDGEMCSVSLFL